jgi:hypothetical protein
MTRRGGVLFAAMCFIAVFLGTVITYVNRQSRQCSAWRSSAST